MSLFNLLSMGAAAMGEEDPQSFADMAGPADPERKGMFGVKGTLRDIIGTIGDAFLMNEGRDPLYYQQRQNEKIGDALRGLNDDPMGAIQRVSAVDGSLGQKYYNDYLASRDRQAKAAQDAENENFKNEDLFRTRIGGMFGAANENTYPAMLANAQKLAKARGYERLLEGLPTAWDEGAVRSFIRGTMTPKDQFNVNYKEQRLGQIDETIKERGRSNRAREGIAGKNANTAAGRAATYDRKVTNDIGYREWRKNNAPPSAAGGHSGRRAPAPNIPPPPPGFKKP